MPITGIASFAKYPIVSDWATIDADITVLGVPYDTGVGFLSGTRFGPRRIREVSTHYARGDAVFYDPERDEVMLGAPAIIRTVQEVVKMFFFIHIQIYNCCFRRNLPFTFYSLKQCLV